MNWWNLCNLHKWTSTSSFVSQKHVRGLRNEKRMHFWSHIGCFFCFGMVLIWQSNYWLLVGAVNRSPIDGRYFQNSNQWQFVRIGQKGRFYYFYSPHGVIRITNHSAQLRLLTAIEIWNKIVSRCNADQYSRCFRSCQWAALIEKIHANSTSILYANWIFEAEWLQKTHLANVIQSLTLLIGETSIESIMQLLSITYELKMISWRAAENRIVRDKDSRYNW